MIQLFTIGHSAHPIEKFLLLLKKYEIILVADIRSMPTSRYHLQFRKKPLTDALTREGISYVFLGQKLGGRLYASQARSSGR